VDPELQQALAQLEGRLTAHIDAVEARLEGRIDAVEMRFRTYVDERIEATETRLLTAFHSWASPLEARQRTHAAALRAIDLEMEALSERVGKLEGNKQQ
jgi:hypothetical protein